MASPLSLPSKSTATTSLSSPTSPSTSTRSLPIPATPTSPTSPLLPPLHQAAQRGDLASLATLLSNSPHPDQLVNQHDDQGITALHWAAINGHLAFSKELLRQGAKVDVKGGELQGTALHWAARNGHLPIVHLLLSYSSDPTLTDAQSFDTLHLSVHSSSAFLLAYLLFTLQPISVDSCDGEGHTGLAWAAYQGDAISVELLLEAGADPNREDNAGLRPLHWAVTKGNSQCIRRLVEAGAELNAREGLGKTARDMAIELKSLAAYNRGLAEAGTDPMTGRTFDVPLSPKKTRYAIFGVVFLVLGIVFLTFDKVPYYAAFLLVAGEAYGMHHLISRVLLGIKSGGGGGAVGGHGHGHGGHGGGGEKLTKSPYLASVIAGSLAWVGWVWVTRFLLLPGSYGLSNLGFLLAYGACCYNFWKACTLDPGAVKREAGEGALKETIESLVDSNNFNGMNFCLTCLVRRPLRSKHSYATGRCVARFDHYCPWVWNDVGVNNHRQFLLFLLSLVAGVIFFIHLTWGYFYERAPSLPPDYACPAISPLPLCVATSFDTFALAVTIWSTLQLTWTSVLLSAQIWQILRQMTTLEVSNVGRFGWMGGKPGVSGQAQQGYVEKWSAAQQARHAAQVGGGAGDGADSLADDPSSLAHAPTASSSGSSTPTPSPSPGVRAKGRFAFLLKLLGLDRFTRHGGRSFNALQHASRGEVSNPFDLSWRGNCVDFWTKGGELGVQYERLYAIPEGGFRRVVGERKRREREERGREREEAAGSGGGLGRLTGRNNEELVRKGYERVAMEDVV
ncbi:hypothetical protein JCM11641_005594 [Rhodosporidiobolus odoratus]